MSYIEVFKSKYEVVREFLLTDKFIALVTAMPIFFGWLVPLTWKEENEKLRSLATDCMILSVVFWFSIFLGIFLGWLPWVGDYLANLIHLVGILVYLGVSFYFLYLIVKDREIPNLPYLVDLRAKVYEFLK